MKELFYADGHLTDDAFLALVHNDENLTELERLEISEHLSFCDECIIRYTACLEDDSLLIAPMLSSQETIIKRIKERVRRVFVNKYATMIVAASFAIIFWSIGIFNIDLENGSGKTLNSFVGSTYSISEKANDFTTKFSNAIKDIFGSIDLRGVSNTNEKE